jgi:hypothetical protein
LSPPFCKKNFFPYMVSSISFFAFGDMHRSIYHIGGVIYN